MTQSQKRYSESLGSLFCDNQDSKKKLLLLKSSSDIGVMRNGGRNGAKYAPQSFLSVFKKLSRDKKTNEYSISEVEVASVNEENQNFSEAQSKQSERISRAIDQNRESFICHLGGGHDHIYPLLTALAKNYKNIVVINIDAHADTRNEIESHSGTPFRQFADEYKGEFQLFQIGLHSYANSSSTLSPLNKGKMSILWREQIKCQKKLGEFFKEIKAAVIHETLVVFSLDADALDGSEIPGVSAVNPHGITSEELFDLWERYQEIDFSHRPVLGIYELNPVYDAPSMLSMRRMAAFVYKTM